MNNALDFHVHKIKVSVVLLKKVLDDYFFPSEEFFFAISKIVPLSTKSLYSLWQCVNQCKEKKRWKIGTIRLVSDTEKKKKGKINGF